MYRNSKLNSLVSGLFLLSAIFVSVGMQPVSAAEIITVNAALTLNSGLANGNRIGINVNYWEDDQSRRPAGSPLLSETLAGMKVTHLRYPGGSKSDIYRWSVAPYNAPNPRLALISPSDWPSNDNRFWSPAGDPSGNWTRNVLDFDEFMTQCRAINCEPNIVVAYGSIYKPANGGDHITRQEALDMAVVWVRYANITKGYNIKYWEIGNETWLNNYANQDPGRTTQANDLIAFSRAMKAVDPTIKIGTNANSQADFDTLLSIAAADIDFLVVHRYPPSGLADYVAYQATTLNTQDSVSAAYNALQNYPAHRDRIKIMMTEISGMTYGTWNQADLGHALMTFESLARILQDNRVEFSMLWNTRWVDESFGEAFALNSANGYTPQGWALHILGNYTFDQMVSATGTSNVLAFASKDPRSGSLNIFLVNKNTLPSQANVTLQNYTAPATGNVMALTGSGAADQNPIFTSQGAVSVADNYFTLSLNPVSITVVQLFVNVAPTDITLSNLSFSENLPADTGIGSFSATDANAGDSHAYSFCGGADDDSFDITGNTLKTKASFDYETKNTYSICVRSTDNGGLSYDKTFNLVVTNVNESPTNSALSKNTISENQPIGTTVGILATTDPDTGDTFVYSFCGGADDGSFSIAGNTLKTAAIFNYEAKKTYSICLRSTDHGRLFFNKTFPIIILNKADYQSVKNGGFEIYSTPASKKPVNWAAGKFSLADGKDAVNKKYGKYSVKIAGAPATSKTLAQTLFISGSTGSPFAFSYWVKGNNIPTTGLCQGQVLFYSGTTLKGAKTIKCPTGTYAWRNIKLSFTAPVAHTKVVIKFTYSKASGMAWFDAVSLLR